MQDFSTKINFKDHNVKRIYYLLRQNSKMTKSELAREAQLSFVSVSKICTTLEESGLVDISENRARTGGRKAAIITFKSIAMWTIAIDIKRTDFMEIGLLDLNNNIHERIGFKLPDDICLEVILDLITRGIDQLTLDRTREVIGICLGISAVYDSKTEIILQSSNAVFERVNLVRYLNEKIPEYSFLLENDANLASLSQARIRNDIQNQLFVFFTQGIGLGIIINGKIYRGANGFAGELGHFKVTGNSKTCKCGALGCFRTVATLKSMAEDLNEIDLLNKSRQNEYAQSLLSRYDLGARDVIDRIDLTAEKIGEVLAVLFDLFNPEEILLGGNISPLLPSMITKIRNKCRFSSNLAKEVDIRVRIVETPTQDLVLQGGGERAFRHWFDHAFSPVENESD